MKQVIYETSGRAREFNSLAINLFTGCGHRCVYCYGANVTHQERAAFENSPKPRVTPQEIEQSACLYRRNGGDNRPILLCFVTDCYQPIEGETQLTRHAIEFLHKYGLNVIILTKGGKRSMRDFDLLTDKDVYATTLTLLDEAESLKWEPGAALPSERIEALKMARSLGIPTWVSLEPVIYPDVTMELVEATHEFVGHYKVGTLNYHPHGKSIDWRVYGYNMKALLDRLGVGYYFKKDLLKEMQWAGDFPQKFQCQ